MIKISQCARENLQLSGVKKRGFGLRMQGPVFLKARKANFSSVYLKKRRFLKDIKTQFAVTWKIMARARPYSNVTEIQPLHKRKFFQHTVCKPGAGTLNERNELASASRHATKYLILLVFSVTPFKIDQNKKSKPCNRLSLESGNKKNVDMQRLSPRFRSQQFFLWEICGETFSPNL